MTNREILSSAVTAPDPGPSNQYERRRIRKGSENTVISMNCSGAAQHPIRGGRSYYGIDTVIQFVSAEGHNRRKPAEGTRRKDTRMESEKIPVAVRPDHHSLGDGGDSVISRESI